VRLVAFCQTAIASGRQVVTKEMTDKSPKICINKGPETYFPEIFDDLFTRENSHQIFYDK